MKRRPQPRAPRRPRIVNAFAWFSELLVLDEHERLFKLIDLALERRTMDAELTLREWLAQFGRERKPCGAPASYYGPGGAPLCDGCAEHVRAALRDPDTLGNVLLGRARTDDEVAQLVRPIQ